MSVRYSVTDAGTPPPSASEKSQSARKASFTTKDTKEHEGNPKLPARTIQVQSTGEYSQFLAVAFFSHALGFRFPSCSFVVNRFGLIYLARRDMKTSRSKRCTS